MKPDDVIKNAESIAELIGGGGTNHTAETLKRLVAIIRYERALAAHNESACVFAKGDYERALDAMRALLVEP